jgi:hypothetical protein
VDAKPPTQDVPGWIAAPNGENIGFDGTVDPKYGGPRASRLKQGDCFNKVDYAYFQTIASVPEGKRVNIGGIGFTLWRVSIHKNGETTTTTQYSKPGTGGKLTGKPE